jgi:hypothetical protein
MSKGRGGESGAGGGDVVHCKERRRFGEEEHKEAGDDLDSFWRRYLMIVRVSEWGRCN